MTRQQVLRYACLAFGIGIVVCGLVSAALWAWRWQAGGAEAAPDVVRTVRTPQWPAAQAKQALTATSTCVRQQFSIDSNEFERDFQRALDCTTGDARTQLSGQRSALEDALGSASTSITATIRNAAVVKFANGRGTFLFSVDTLVRSGSSADDRPIRRRIIADATLVDGRYLVSRMESSDVD
jgi:hypothetical protein